MIAGLLEATIDRRLFTLESDSLISEDNNFLSHDWCVQNFDGFTREMSKMIVIINSYAVRSFLSDETARIYFYFLWFRNKLISEAAARWNTGIDWLI